jgi:hypothetical protein
MAASKTLRILDASLRTSQAHFLRMLSDQHGEKQSEKIRGAALFYNARAENGRSASFHFNR